MKFSIKKSYIYKAIEVAAVISVIVLGAIFPPVALALSGITFSVISFSSYRDQREILRGKEHNAVSVGYTHVGMCSLIFVMLLLLSVANPILGPIIPFIPIVWASLAAISMIAALCNSDGGYAKLRNDWVRSSWRILIPLKLLVIIIDFCLRIIPGPLARVLKAGFAKLHHYLGTFYFTAQIALFVFSAATAAPILGAVLGVVGLSYSALSILRAANKNWFPKIICDGLDKVDKWVSLLAGIFVKNSLMAAYSYYALVSSVITDFALPYITRAVLGKDSEFLEMNEGSTIEKSLFRKYSVKYVGRNDDDIIMI